MANPTLLQVVHATRASAASPSGLHGRQEKGNQDGDDGDDDQQLDESETTTCSHGCPLPKKCACVFQKEVTGSKGEKCK